MAECSSWGNSQESVQRVCNCTGRLSARVWWANAGPCPPGKDVRALTRLSVGDAGVSQPPFSGQLVPGEVTEEDIDANASPILGQNNAADCAQDTIPAY